MVVRVKLKGLKIARNKRGRYFVYVRGTKHALVKNFEGDRDALLARLAEVDAIAIYNAARRYTINRPLAEGTLGALINWFKTECPRYAKLSGATRADYEKAYDWLAPGFDCPLH